jgi:hypothetical protein
MDRMKVARQFTAWNRLERSVPSRRGLAVGTKALSKRGASYWSAELHRLRGVFFAAMSADDTPIEASFGEAIRIAKKQKSVSLEKRAEGTYAQYRRQKASGSGGRGFRLPLW